jgi:hypothetical protein
MESKPAGYSSKANKQQYKMRLAKGLCVGCGVKGRKRLPGRATCRKCTKKKGEYWYKYKETMRVANLKYKTKLRDDVFNAYGGPKCKCCREEHIEFLTIDHIDGGGAEHRRKIGKATQQVYLYLRRNNYPSGFQVLCMNCNFSIGIRGYCPHQKEKHLGKIRR